MTVLAFKDFPTPDPASLEEPARSLALALSGQFAIKREIGRGGMGVVYLARDKRLDRLVAIKALPPHVAADPAVRERFMREAKTAGAMSHPNIVPIHGVDEAGGHAFFVMSFIEGESIASQVRTHGRLDQRQVVRYLRDVACALDHAHGRGIIHRDVKAENILVDRATNRALVTDFGIARLAEAKPLTATGQLVGTVYYVSPEQVSGAPGDARSDIYSLGVVGYFALAGCFPFDADVASAVLVAHVTKQPLPLRSIAPSVAPALAAIVDGCLEKDPNKRPTSAAELASALEAIIPAVERHATSSAAPELRLSDTEAHAVWLRAAELQTLTGAQDRPPAPLPARSSDRPRVNGMPVQEAAAAAREAGIGDAFFERALEEHGLGATPLPPRAQPFATSPEHAPIGDYQTGGRFEEAMLNGELKSRDFERVIGTLHYYTGDVGEVTANMRELAWGMKSLGRVTRVSVVPADGRTIIRVSENGRIRRFLNYAASISLVGGLAGFGVGAFVHDVIVHHDGPAFAAWAAMIAGSVAIGAALNRREAIGARRRVQSLVQLLSLKVRECLDFDGEKR